MPYNKEELFKLPAAEKYELVLDLWESIDDELLGSKISRKNIEEELDRLIDEITKHPERVVSWKR